MPVNLSDQAACCGTDRLQRGFQLCRFTSRGSAGDIPEGVVRGFNSVMLADGIGDTLCLYLFRPGIHTFLIIPGMERCMGDLVNQCLHGLDFAHAVLNGNPIIRGMKIPLGTSPDLFKANQNWRCLLQRGEQTAVPIDGSDQFFGAQRRQLFAFGLADIKGGSDPERWTFYLNVSFFGLPSVSSTGCLVFGSITSCSVLTLCVYLLSLSIKNQPLTGCERLICIISYECFSSANWNLQGEYMMLTLVKPAFDELWFTEKLMTDEDNMSYNARWAARSHFRKTSGNPGMSPG